jgi:hypothetical protein
MKMGGQFEPKKGWSVCSGKHPKSDLFRGGQFKPESGGQFERILQITSVNKYEFIGYLFNAMVRKKIVSIVDGY